MLSSFGDLSTLFYKILLTVINIFFKSLLSYSFFIIMIFLNYPSNILKYI
jgi:hypothetical protein